MKQKLKAYFAYLGKRLATIALIIGIFAGIAEISGFSLRDLFSSFSNPNSFSLTVLVHGKDGKDDKILRNQGKVVLDIGGDRKEETINEQGEATFKELPKSYIAAKALVSVDHPQPYLPIVRDSLYILSSNKPIYLAIELKGIHQVEGRVIDKTTEKPLKSVRVSVQNVATHTDKFGWFALEIPKEKQAKYVRVNFYKEGYKMEDVDSIAPHTKQEIGIALEKE